MQSLFSYDRVHGSMIFVHEEIKIDPTFKIKADTGVFQKELDKTAQST